MFGSHRPYISFALFHLAVFSLLSIHVFSRASFLFLILVSSSYLLINSPSCLPPLLFFLFPLFRPKLLYLISLFSFSSQLHGHYIIFLLCVIFIHLRYTCPLSSPFLFFPCSFFLTFPPMSMYICDPITNNAFPFYVPRLSSCLSTLIHDCFACHSLYLGICFAQKS